MNILVFGLGALGTVFSACLKAAGHRVYGITKEKYIGKFKNNTLKIKGLFGEKEAQLDDIFTSAEESKNLKIDLIIVSVKAYDTETAISQIKPFLNDAMVLLAQNGYGNYEIATSLLDRERVILSRIIFGAKLIETGFAEVTVFGDEVIIGQPDGTVDETKLKEIAKVFTDAGIPTAVSKDVYAILWDKIIYNSALNPLGAILECTYGRLAENEETKFIMNKIIEEIFDVTEAKGIKLNWKSAEDYIRYFYEKLVPPTAEHFPSMYYDIKQGKKTEIEALNGAVVRLAKEAGISASVNETITKIIKAKEKLRSD
uniref:2-dehydropantoate 2-reductase n=1 Tax=Thermodesulfovibrio aggregans TaxID=86166 RepID=A0A7C4ELS5_9BACT